MRRVDHTLVGIAQALDQIDLDREPALAGDLHGDAAFAQILRMKLLPNRLETFLHESLSQRVMAIAARGAFSNDLSIDVLDLSFHFHRQG
jgi:hypothetical protein